MANIRQERIAKGFCRYGDHPRGQDGTSTECRAHADARSRKQAANLALARARRRRRRQCIDCGEKLPPKSKHKGSRCNVCRDLQRMNDKRYYSKPGSQ